MFGLLCLDTPTGQHLREFACPQGVYVICADIVQPMSTFFPFIKPFCNVRLEITNMPRLISCYT